MDDVFTIRKRVIAVFKFTKNMLRLQFTVLLQPVPEGPEGQAEQFRRFCLYPSRLFERFPEKRSFGVFEHCFQIQSFVGYVHGHQSGCPSVCGPFSES